MFKLSREVAGEFCKSKTNLCPYGSVKSDGSRILCKHRRTVNMSTSYLQGMAACPPSLVQHICTELCICQGVRESPICRISDGGHRKCKLAYMPQAGLTLDCIGYRMFRVINFFVLPAFSKYRVRRQCLKMNTLQKGKFLLATSCFDFLS